MNYNNYLSILILILLNINFVRICATDDVDASSTHCNVPRPPRCGEHEVLNQCGNRCERTCDTIIRPRPCTQLCAGPPACVCGPGYVRHANKTCVLPAECCSQRECPKNEKLTLCGRLNEKTCENPDGPPICERLPCSISTENCTCDDGYVRNPIGVCVTPDKCPNCKTNETYTACGSSCPNTCNPRADAKVVCPAVCIEGCFCKKGYVNSKIYGRCILSSDCPNSEKCFDTEVYKKCGTACPDTCDNYRTPNRPCTKQCVAGCFCKDGYVLNHTKGECVKLDQCPIPPCGKHEEYKDCGTACPDTCANLGTKRKCSAQCVKGCFCVPPYVRSANGKCVRPDQCPVNETCTKPNERYNPCGTPNQRSCSNFFTYIRPACDCKEVCECLGGYVRDAHGLCVRPQDCSPSVCGKNEIYDCGSACDRECARLGEPCPIQNVVCNSKCYCKEGYARDSKNKCIPVKECPPKHC